MSYDSKAFCFACNQYQHSKNSRCIVCHRLIFELIARPCSRTALRTTKATYAALASSSTVSTKSTPSTDAP